MITVGRIREVAFRMLSGESVEDLKARGVTPFEAKHGLAWAITFQYHGPRAADDAADHWLKTFSGREFPEDAPKITLDEKELKAVDLLVKSGLVESKNQSRSMIDQGAVEFNGEKVKDHSLTIQLGLNVPLRVKVGKRKFARVFSCHVEKPIVGEQ